MCQHTSYTYYSMYNISIIIIQLMSIYTLQYAMFNYRIPACMSYAFIYICTYTDTICMHVNMQRCKPHPFTRRRVWQQSQWSLITYHFSRPLLAAQPISMLIHDIMWCAWFNGMTFYKFTIWLVAADWWRHTVARPFLEWRGVAWETI